MPDFYRPPLDSIEEDPFMRDGDDLTHTPNIGGRYLLRQPPRCRRARSVCKLFQLR
jgi:hypothetical protein